MNSRDDIKAKIAKLMALGNDPSANVNEAETALRHAAALMRKHAIEEAEIADATGTKPTWQWGSSFVAANPGQPQTATSSWLGVIALGVSILTDTKSAWTRDPLLGTGIAFQGELGDINYAEYLQAMLRDAVRNEAARFVGSRSEKETFRRAMAGRLQERMKQLKMEQRSAMQDAAVGEKAMVLRDSKIALRDEQFGKQEIRRSSRRHAEAFAHNAGRDAGNKVGFGRPVGYTTRALAH